MKISFILWNSKENISYEEAIKNKNYTVLYNYVTKDSEEYKKISSLFNILKSKNIIKDPETVTEVSWVDISS